MRGKVLFSLSVSKFEVSTHLSIYLALIPLLSCLVFFHTFSFTFDDHRILFKYKKYKEVQFPSNHEVHECLLVHSKHSKG